ncbi:hypothetical protein CWE34_22995 [Bacillus sp. SN10]|nr:hypothetical protein CWE34_22995 [Bacillus sp. SN10]
MLSSLLLYVAFTLSRYLPGSKTPPQNSAKAKKLGRGRADNQWRMNKTPLIKVSFYNSLYLPINSL